MLIESEDDFWLLEGKRKKARFEVYKDSRGQFRFRLIAPNNEIVAVSEAYTSKANCINGVEAVTKYAAVAEIEDKT